MGPLPEPVVHEQHATADEIVANIPGGGVRAVQVPLDTIQGVVQRTKPVALSAKHEGVPFGVAMVQAGREVIPCVGYEDFAPIVSGMTVGDTVTMDGKLKQHLDQPTQTIKRFFYVGAVHSTQVAPASKTTPRPAGNGRRSTR